MARRVFIGHIITQKYFQRRLLIFKHLHDFLHPHAFIPGDIGSDLDYLFSPGNLQLFLARLQKFVYRFFQAVDGPVPHIPIMYAQGQHLVLNLDPIYLPQDSLKIFNNPGE